MKQLANFKVSSDAYIVLGIAVVAGIGLYFAIKKGLLGLGGLASGNNSLTKGTPYQGAGVAGTLGAATNTVLGGAPQSIGESIGSGLYSIFGQDTSNAASMTYIVNFPDGSRHGVDSSSVDASGQFTYGGIRYQIGQLQDGSRMATQIYGKGYSSTPNADMGGPNFGIVDPNAGW